MFARTSTCCKNTPNTEESAAANAFKLSVGKLTLSKFSTWFSTHTVLQGSFARVRSETISVKCPRNATRRGRRNCRRRFPNLNTDTETQRTSCSELPKIRRRSGIESTLRCRLRASSIRRQSNISSLGSWSPESVAKVRVANTTFSD